MGSPFIENPNEYSDEQLMVLYQEGNSMAFEALYLRHEKRIYTYLGKRLFEEDAISEVFQNTWLKLHKSKSLYRPKHLFVKWLYVISKSELFDYCKKKRVETIPLDAEIQVSNDTESSDEIDVANLPDISDREREVLNLKFNEDLDFNEISQRLNISSSNARKISSRAISKLKLLFGGEKS